MSLYRHYFRAYTSPCRITIFHFLSREFVRNSSRTAQFRSDISLIRLHSFTRRQARPAITFSSKGISCPLGSPRGKPDTIVRFTILGQKRSQHTPFTSFTHFKFTLVRFPSPCGGRKRRSGTELTLIPFGLRKKLSRPSESDPLLKRRLEDQTQPMWNISIYFAERFANLFFTNLVLDPSDVWFVYFFFFYKKCVMWRVLYIFLIECAYVS